LEVSAQVQAAVAAHLHEELPVTPNGSSAPRWDFVNGRVLDPSKSGHLTLFGEMPTLNIVRRKLFPMSKNIIVCCGGTGNEISERRCHTNLN
jgi:hypothetical protein